MKVLSKVRFRTLLVGIFSLLSLLSSIVFYFYIFNLQQNLYTKSFRANSRKMLDTVHLGIEVGLIAEDFSAIQKVFKWVKQNPDFAWLVITDRHDEIFANFPLDLSLTKKQIKSFARHPSLDAKYYVVSKKWSSPFESGTIYLAVSTAGYVKNRAAVLKGSMITAFVLWILVAGVSFLISIAVSKPLENFQEITGLIAGGNTDVRIPEKNILTMEYLNLKNSFNIMLDRLFDSQNKLKSANSSLEKTNKELVEVNRLLDIERRKSDSLLLNILPASIAERLKNGENLIADNFDNVSVLFADIVGFTELSHSLRPSEIIDMLNRIFFEFDHLSDEKGIEKIKTIGDCYMAVAGLPEAKDGHETATADYACQMLRIIERINKENHSSLQIRIGIHNGPVVAGVIGKNKFVYDLWGDTVNTASRMESTGIPGKIQVTENFYRRIRDRFPCQPRGKIRIKGKGEMNTYMIKYPPAADKDGSISR